MITHNNNPCPIQTGTPKELHNNKRLQWSVSNNIPPPPNNNNNNISSSLHLPIQSLLETTFSNSSVTLSDETITVTIQRTVFLDDFRRLTLKKRVTTTTKVRETTNKQFVSLFLIN